MIFSLCTWLHDVRPCILEILECIHLRLIKKLNKIRCPPGRQSSHCSRHLAWLFSALQLILSKCKLKKNVPNGFRARLNFGLVEDLNEFYRNVSGIIGKHSETIVISFQPVTFIIIIPLFRHANFWLLLTIAAVEKPHNIQDGGFFPHVLMCFHLCCWALDVWYVALWLEKLESCACHSEVAQ